MQLSDGRKKNLVENSSGTDEMKLQSDEKEQGANEDIRTTNITQNNETEPITLDKKEMCKFKKEQSNE